MYGSDLVLYFDHTERLRVTSLQKCSEVMPTVRLESELPYPTRLACSRDLCSVRSLWSDGHVREHTLKVHQHNMMFFAHWAPGT